MTEMFITVLIFLALMASALGCLAICERLPAHHRHDDTANVVRHVAGVFVVMTSLVLGLMITSAKNTFEGIDHNVHAFATQLILLDRSLEQYGPETKAAQQNLIAYLQQAIAGTWAEDGQSRIDDKVAEGLLYQAGDSLKAIRPSDAARIDLWNAAQQQFQKTVEWHWVLVEQSEGTIPVPILVILVAWFVVIFASFGYRAPRNAVVMTAFVLAALLISSSLYLILDMDIPFSGPIQISPAPLERVLAEMQQ